jgi:WD40 repeat protein
MIVGAQVLSDGRVLSWSWDYTLRLWDGKSGAPLAVMVGNTSGVQGAQVLPDGRVLSWSQLGNLRIWDGQSGAPLVEIDDEVEGAQVLPDGRVLSWSWDGTLRLWDGQSGAPLAVMEGHTDRIEGARVLPDGKLLSWSRDHTLRLWDGQSGASLDVIPSAWVWHHGFPAPWADSLLDIAIAGAQRTKNTWAQREKTFVAFAHQSGSWRALWHGASNELFGGATESQFIVSSGRLLLFLQLMHGANPSLMVEELA